jgi:hypothetical protein
MLLKGCLLIISSLFLLTASFTQSRKDRFEREKFNTSRFKAYEVKINIKKSDRIPVHFAGFRVVDMRADTSKSGFVRMGEKPADYRFVFPKQNFNYLAQQLNELLIPGNTTDTLVLFFNSVWLYQVNEQAGGFKSTVLTNENQLSHCYLNAKVFIARQNKLVQLGTLDTAVFKRGWIGNSNDEILKSALINTVRFCNGLYDNQSSAISETEQPQNDIDFAILKTGSFKKGIYFNYKDFLNDSPDTSYFTVEIKNDRRIIHSPSLPDSVTISSWGYCDETGIYMNIDKDFYKLIRSHNTFDVWGPASVEVRNTAAGKILNTFVSYLISRPYVDLSAFIEPSHAIRNYMKYYQLDIRTGLLK